jgi:hypothetical protein
VSKNSNKLDKFVSDLMELIPEDEGHDLWSAFDSIRSLVYFGGIKDKRELRKELRLALAEYAASVDPEALTEWYLKVSVAIGE